MSGGLTHFDAAGDAHMVDVTDKEVTSRTAIARGFVTMAPATLDLVRAGAASKGDVLAVARLAGIMGAKKTADLIPLCHPLPLSKVAVEFTLEERGVAIEASVRTTGRTGVEMEALSAVSIAALTIYDMLKAVQKDMEIGDIRLAFKEGGTSGRYEGR